MPITIPSRTRHATPSRRSRTRTPYHPTLLPIPCHLDTLSLTLIPADLARPLRRGIVLRRRIIVLVQRRGLAPRAILTLRVRGVLCVRVVWVCGLVEGEVVLWDLVVAGAFGVGDEELVLLVRIILQSRE